MNHLILVTGDKGGVGKSFTSRILIDFLDQAGVGISIFDTDITNSTLFRFYSHGDRVTQLDFENIEALDSLLNDLSLASNKTLLIDCAAGSLGKFSNWMSEIDLLSLKDELKFKISLVFVLSSDKDCVAILKDVEEEFKNDAQYIIVRNQGRGSDFSLYDNSKVRSKLLEKRKCTEINLPKLLEKTAVILDKMNLTVSEAIDHPEIQIADKSRIRVFRRRVKEEVDQGIKEWI